MHVHVRAATLQLRTEIAAEPERCAPASRVGAEPIQEDLDRIRSSRVFAKAVDALWEVVSDDGRSALSKPRYFQYHGVMTKLLVPSFDEDDAL